MKKVIVVVGPTGVGKTKLGVRLSQLYDGEVISGDSMQIYRMMDIGTAKATKEEMENIVHHQLDIRMPDESYSVSDFQSEVRAWIDDITAREKMPVIVGGTGLYIKATLYDYHFEESEIDHEAFNARYVNYSNEELYKRLEEVDLEAAKTLHPNNRRRVLRAIEIYETTGRKKSEMEEAQSHTMIYDAYIIGLTLERDQLYARIDERVVKMMEAGLEEEVRTIYDRYHDLQVPAMKAIGYKEWFPYFKGEITRDEVLLAIQKNSRNYAKRQYTWFNHQMPVHWYQVNLEDFDETISQIQSDLNKWLNT